LENFLELDFTITPAYEGRDILVALLDNMGYDSFQETPNGLKAYILEEDFNEEELKQLFLFSSDEFTLSYTKDKLENKNWNEEWETNYSPIFIDDKIHIRAPFHPAKPEFEIELLIVPKMSFGTGHHQTTRLVSRLMLDMDIKGKKLLDMGTGTGVLAILAEKRGAEPITAIDNFEWAVENTAENAEANDCKHITALHGDAALLPGMSFDVVLANINRNVLLEDMKIYIETLTPQGRLLISGFFENDFEMLHSEAVKHGMELVKKVTEDRWMACHFQRLP
jgi:ribosomal protein L11 methyltransferase